MSALKTALSGSAGVSLAAALLATSGTASLAETLTLKFGHTFPSSHYIQKELVDVFVAGIDKASNGEIKFEVYPAAQLGKDTAGLLSGGLIDMGAVVTGVQADKFPLSSVSELPEISESACDGSARAWSLAKSGGALDVNEYEPQGLHALSTHVLAAYVLFTRTQKVETSADVAGLKLWASGPAAQKAISDLGGVAIRIPSTELYDAATRGTIDGAIFPYSGLTQYKLEPILKHAANGVNFGTGTFLIAMTESRWGQLTEPQQKIISEQLQAAQQHFCEWLDASDDELREQVEATDGYQSIELEGDAKAEFIDKLLAVSDEWAADLDAKGRKGSEVLKAYKDAGGQ